MSEPFAAKLALVLKVLSMSPARLAADLAVDKSAVGRWVRGGAEPSAHNLSALTTVIAGRAPGFTSLDWDRSLESLAGFFGVEAASAPGVPDRRDALPLPLLGQVRARTALRGASYEGFFRSTRPFGRRPGRFLHDHCMVRKDDNGLLRLNMATGGVFVDGWALPLHDQLFIVGTEFTSGSFVFALLNGVEAARVDVIDGLILSAILDEERTPTAMAVVFERIGALTGDRAADDARFSELAAVDPLVPDGALSEALQAHLTRDIGPTQFALGGDWLLRLPPSASMSTGSSDI